MRFALATVTLVVLAGCVAKNTAPADSGADAGFIVPFDEGNAAPDAVYPPDSDFVVSVGDAPSALYIDRPVRMPMEPVVSVGRPWPGYESFDHIPPHASESDARTREFCALFDVGAPDCRTVKLWPAQTAAFTPSWRNRGEGNRTMTLEGMSVTMLVTRSPLFGAWVHAAGVDMRVSIRENQGENATFVIDAVFSQNPPISHLIFTPTGTRIDWSSTPVHLELPSTRPHPMEACASLFVGDERQQESYVLYWIEAGAGFTINGDCN